MLEAIAHPHRENNTPSLLFKHLWHMVGNTPMIALKYRYRGKRSTIYVKCEHYNLTGSLKDRMALYILHKAYSEGLINPGDTIIEATSGNTGISFAAIGKSLGHPVKILMPAWLSVERKTIIKSMGAEIISVSKEEGGFLGSIAMSQELAEKGGAFLPRQFENLYNAEAHEKTTGPEIWQQLAAIGLKPNAFIAGVGTGGTVMGTGMYLRVLNPRLQIFPLEPAESPTLSTGYKIGSHRIQGISDEFIPSIVDLSKLDDIVQANDGDAIIMAQKLGSQLGLAVGISSGANVLGAIKVKEQLGDEAVVVTLFCDSNKKYLSTDLMKEEPVKAGYISSETAFENYEPIARLQEAPLLTEFIPEN